MGNVILTKQESKVLLAFRRGATSKDIRAILERNLTMARSSYEDTEPANEFLRQDVVAAKRILDMLFTDTIELEQ